MKSSSGFVQQAFLFASFGLPLSCICLFGSQFRGSASVHRCMSVVDVGEWNEQNSKTHPKQEEPISVGQNTIAHPFTPHVTEPPPASPARPARPVQRLRGGGVGRPAGRGPPRGGAAGELHLRPEGWRRPRAGRHWARHRQPRQRPGAHDRRRLCAAHPGGHHRRPGGQGRWHSRRSGRQTYTYLVHTSRRGRPTLLPCHWKAAPFR